MEPKVIVEIVWLAILILFAAAEAISVGLTSIWFAAGAAAGLVTALLGGPIWLQILLFIAVSALCLLLVRPVAQRYLKPGYQPTNADRVIGMTAVVTEDISNLQGQGQVSVGGNIWTARSDTDAVIPAGTHVTILRIEGVKVFVEQLKEEAVL